MKKQLITLSILLVLASGRAWAADYDWIPVTDTNDAAGVAIVCGLDAVPVSETGEEVYSLELSDSKQDEIAASLDAGNDVYVSVTVKERVDIMGLALGAYRGTVLVKAGSRILAKQTMQGLNVSEDVYEETVVVAPLGKLTDLSQPITVSMESMAKASCPLVNPSMTDQASVSIDVTAAKLYY